MEIFLIIIVVGILLFWFFQQERIESGTQETFAKEKDNLRPTGPPPELKMGADEKPRYKKSRYFLSPAERKFFDILVNLVGDKYQIFAQTRMAEVLFVANEPVDRIRYDNHLRCRHLDFLLCDVKEKRPLLAIELDDSSHKNYYRKENDEFKNTACESAGLPLLRFKVKQNYSKQEILDSIQEKLEN